MVNFCVTSSLENMDRFLVTPVTARQRSTTSDSSSTPRIASSPLCPLNLALNLEDDEEQEIFDDPLAVQTEVIELSSQKSPVWECIDVTPIKDLLL